MGTRQLIGTALVAACLTATRLGGWQPADAQDAATMRAGVVNSTATGEIEVVSNRLLSKEIELMQMITRFRLNNRQETNSHRWAVGVLSTAAYSVANAGNIVTFTTGFRYHTQPQNLTRGRAQSGPLLIFLGELLFVARTGIPTMLDAYNAVKVHDRGFDKNTFEHHAMELHAEIQQLLKEHAQAAAGLPAAQQEQAILSGIATVAYREFIINYARAVRMQRFRLWNDLLKNVTSSSGAFAGALPTYLGGVQTRPRLTAPGGIGFICSGAVFASHLALARWLSLKAEKASQAALAGRLSANDVSTDEVTVTTKNLQQQIQQLNAVASRGASDTAAASRLKAYRLVLNAASDHDGLDKLERRKDQIKFWHDEFINAIEGGANIAAGAELTNAGFHYRPQPNPLSQLKGARHFLTRFAWGAVTFTPTASVGMVETPGAFVLADRISRKDLPGGPDRVLNQRLDNLTRAAQLASAP